MRRNSALDAALELSRSPHLSELMSRQPLPSGVELMLRVLAADGEATKEAQVQSQLRFADLASVAELYVFRILFARGATPYRVLGVEHGADRAQARRHMGLLLKWLHPDRNSDVWRAAFAERVISAWRLIDREMVAAKCESRPASPPAMPLPPKRKLRSRPLPPRRPRAFAAAAVVCVMSAGIGAALWLISEGGFGMISAFLDVPTRNAVHFVQIWPWW